MALPQHGSFIDPSETVFHIASTRLKKPRGDYISLRRTTNAGQYLDDIGVHSAVLIPPFSGC